MWFCVWYFCVGGISYLVYNVLLRFSVCLFIIRLSKVNGLYVVRKFFISC